MKSFLFHLGLLATTAVCTFAADTAPVAHRTSARNLFDGKTLGGWSIKGANGKATFEVKDRVIVGTSAKGGANTFLCTDRSYQDFELEIEVKLEEKDKSYMNSGIQLRSHVKPVGKKEAGRVSGWQCEVDPSDRAWTGGIQEEAGRAWLQPVKPAEKDAKLPEFTAGKSFKHNDWNHFRIVCEGHRIRTWVNGVPGADLTDELGALEGFIALQVHAGPEGCHYYFRNIKLLELTRKAHQP